MNVCISEKKDRIGIASTCIAFIVGCLLLATLTGCATQNAGNVTKATDQNSAVDSATLLKKTITFPAWYFQGKEKSDVVSALQSQGYSDVIANEDGSYTVTVSIDQYNQLVDSLHDNIVTLLNSTVGSADSPNVLKVDYDNSFSNIKVYLTTNKIGLSEALLPVKYYVAACIYQQIAGQPVSCTVSIIGADGNQLSSTTYPKN